MEVSISSALTSEDHEAENLDCGEEDNEVKVLLEVVGSDSAFFEDSDQSAEFWLRAGKDEIREGGFWLESD